MSRQPMRARSVHLALVAAATSTASLPAVALFATATEVVPVFVGAALVGVAPGWLALVRRWSAPRTLLVAVIAVVLFMAVLGGVAAVGGRGLTAFGEVGQGWLRGPATLLTANLPLDTAWADLAFVASVVLVTALVAGVLAARTGSPVTPLVPIVALFSAGIAVTASTPAAHQASMVGLVAAAVVFVVVRATARAAASVPPTRARIAALQRVGGAGLLPLAVLIALIALVPLGVLQPTGAGQRADPRSLVNAHLAVQVRISPLSRVKTQLQTTPPVPLFEAVPLGPTRLGDRIRTAALESYDGVTWTSTFPYAAAGRHFFPDPGMIGGRVVSARITISQLDGLFLPVIGYPVQLAETAPPRHRLAFDSASGTVVDLDQLRRGYTYEVTGQVRDRDADLALASQPAPAEFAPYVALPADVPAEIRRLSANLTVAQHGSLAKLTAIENHIRELPYRLDVPAGHTYASILGLLGTAETPPGGGFAEQRAAAFAVLARLAGIPTRVAVGYRLTGDPTLLQVSTPHAHAWPESYFPGYGWVPFEPTDFDRSNEPPPPRAGTIPQPPPPSPDPSPDEQAQSSPSRPQATPAGPVTDRPGHLLLWALALPVLALAALTAGKQRRRWSRRRSGQPADRVRGAWRESMDRLTEHGFRERACDTPQETAVRATRVFGTTDASLLALAPLVTSAAFSATPPNEEQVAQAWRHERDIWQALNGNHIGYRKARAFLDPRPLWRIHARNRHRNGGNTP